MKDNEQAKHSMWKTTKFMLRLAWQKRKSVIFIALVLVVLTTLLNLAELLITPIILARLEAAVSPKTIIYTILFFTFALLILNGLKGYYSTLKLPARIELRLKIMLLCNTKYAAMSYPYIEDESVIKKHQKAILASESNLSPTEAIWDTLTDICVAFSAFMIYIIMLTNVNVIVISISAATCIASYFIGKKINEWGFRHREEKEEYLNRLEYAQDKSEDVSFAKDIRIFGMRQWVDDMYYASVSLLTNFIKKAEKKYLRADLIDLLFAFARNAIAYFYLISLVLSNSITVPQFLLYFTAVSAFTSMLTQFLVKLNELQKQSIELSTLLDFLELKELFNFEDGKSIAPKSGKPYEIKLNNVSFKYPGAENYTLKNINFTLAPGEKVAVVGLNGAGKTTLVKLICGFYDPSEGEVLLNGENIKNFNRRDYYTFFTAVFQDFSVIDVTVAQNIAQTMAGIDTKKVNDCLDKAGLLEKVKGFKNGIDTYVGREIYEDGVEMSGGEMQRLMLARALYKNAPIIMLDEPTAALDPLAESDIYSKYNEMTQGHSSVFISHRLASTRFCDRIIFIDGGHIAEEGTHEELLKLGKKYAELYEVQSKYYKEGENF